jgi:elongation factor 3
MVKLLTGELEASKGDCWQHPACRCAYVAQHAFHHIEQHTEKTANEYIRWRYQYGEDREAVVKKTMIVSDEEMAMCQAEYKYEIVEQNGTVKVSKRSFKRMTGLRRKDKKSGQHEYEIVWNPAAKGPAILNTWERSTLLMKIAKPFQKMIKVIDTKEAAKEGMYQRPLTQKNVEQHLEDVGLEAEFGTHNRISALSGGQKVKVVIGAAMWNQPHIVILDEPTNYLDRESLGALAHAIQEFEGGVVIISHNDDFCSKLCKETWVLELGHLDCKGDAEWMKKAEEAAVNQTQLTEMIDGGGNTIKLKTKGKNLSRKQRKMLEKTLKDMQDAGEDTYDIEEQLGYFDEVPAAKPVTA